MSLTYVILTIFTTYYSSQKRWPFFNINKKKPVVFIVVEKLLIILLFHPHSYIFGVGHPIPQLPQNS